MSWLRATPSNSRIMTRSNASRRRGLGNGTDSGNMKSARARFTTKTAAPQSCSPSGRRRSWRFARAPSAKQVTGFEFDRDRWDFYHAVRTFMSIVALASVTAGRFHIEHNCRYHKVDNFDHLPGVLGFEMKPK